MIKELLSRWPVIKQIQTGSDGTGPEAWSERTRHLLPKTDGAEKTRSICPYCAVGCGQLIYHKDNKLISIEGDPDSPISRGRLCPKGSATYQLHTHSARLKKVKYRRPYATEWEELELDTAMKMSRTVPHLSELQPELFCEISPSLLRSSASSTANGSPSLLRAGSYRPALL